jgi:multidrug resistance protein, MATE family
MEVNSDPHKQFLSVALPMVLAAMAGPLPGIVDTAILGHLQDVRYLSAVAVGSTVIGVLIWSFSFLRMAATATTARALGAKNLPQCQLLLAQSLLLAGGLGTVIVLLQKPLLTAGFTLITVPEQSLALSFEYTRIRIFAAPAILGTFCITGWLIGTQNARAALGLVIFVNTINVGLDFWLILGLKMNSEGAALASLLAEYLGFFAGLWIVRRLTFAMNAPWSNSDLLDLNQYRELFSVNRHLLVRTTVLIFTFAFFTSQGARQGATTLAANAILMQLFFLFSFALDGFAQAAEALSGQAIGAKNEPRFYYICKLAAKWGFALAGLTTGLYLLFDTTIIAIFTDIEEVALGAGRYFIWLALVPLTAVGSFLLDGIFLGAAKTRSMQNIMVIAVFRLVTTVYGYLFYCLWPRGRFLWQRLFGKSVNTVG